MVENKKNESLDLEEAVSKSEAFLLKNKKTIIGAIAAVVIVIAAIFAYQSLYKTPRENKAQAALFKGEQYFENDNFDMALNGDSLGFAGLLKVAEEFSGSQSGTRLCWFEHG